MTGDEGVVAVLVDAPLFCRLILAISSSSESCLAVVTFGFTANGEGLAIVGVVAGDDFLVLPFSES